MARSGSAWDDSGRDLEGAPRRVTTQLYTLTGSNFAVGALGIVELVPLVVFGLYGGALADHVDRRRMLVATGLAQVVLTALLALNAFLEDPRIWAVYLLGGLLSVAQSLQRPSKEALEPRTVAHDQIMAANALSSLGMQVDHQRRRAVRRGGGHDRAVAARLLGLRRADRRPRSPATCRTSGRMRDEQDT